MPKKERPSPTHAPAEVRTQNAPRGVALGLIERRKSNASSIPAPSEAALAELKTLLDHNDVAAYRERVPSADAIDMLRTFGWTGSNTTALDTVCRISFGRKSYGTK